MRNVHQILLPRPVDEIEIGGFSVKDFCRYVGIGRTNAYEELKAGRLRAKKCGKRTIILKSEALRWLDALPSQRN